MRDPGHTALGTWSGGRFMHFGEPLDDDRLEALLRPGAGIDTVITADVYGAGRGRRAARPRAGGPAARGLLPGRRRSATTSTRASATGPKGFPRFTDPRLRGPEGYADYVRMATERSLERCGVDAFDLLLLHNPDRTGYASPDVWDGDGGRARRRPDPPARRRPRPGERLHARPHRLLRALRRADRLGDDHPQPARALARRAGPRAAATSTTSSSSRASSTTAASSTTTCCPATSCAAATTAASGPTGWVEAGREKLERMRPIAERHGLTMLQLACQWNLAQAPVACVAPTLIQEAGDGAKTIEAKRAELARRRPRRCCLETRSTPSARSGTTPAR